MFWSSLVSLSPAHIFTLLGTGAVLASCIFAPLYFLFRQRSTAFRQQLEMQSEQLQAQLVLRSDELKQAQAQHWQLHGDCQQLQAKLAEKQNQINELQTRWQKAEDMAQDTQAYAHRLELELTDVKTTLVQKQQSFDAQLAQLEQSKLVLKQEFENLATQIFEDKSEKFARHSQDKISQLLQPVQGELKGFRDKMEAIHSEELKQRAALRTELLHLQANNQAITEQASKLTNALQGQKKTQGNWEIGRASCRERVYAPV